MVFWIIIIAIIAISLTISIITNSDGTNCVLLTALIVSLVIFISSLANRKQNIYSYNECKAYPEYFSNEERKNNNKIISHIKAHQGTILSFYNGIEFKYFEIEDGQKVIVNEGEIK